MGRDAAVAGDYKDLKFRNDTEYPVYIEAYAKDGKLVCNLYGHEIHDTGHEVEFEMVFEGTIPKPAEKVTQDDTKPEGYREITYTGKTGSKVSIYKIVKENGKQVSKEWFSSSTYRATADEVTIGTKKVEEVKEEEVIPAKPTITEPESTILVPERAEIVVTESTLTGIPSIPELYVSSEELNAPSAASLNVKEAVLLGVPSKADFVSVTYESNLIPPKVSVFEVEKKTLTE